MELELGCGITPQPPATEVHGHIARMSLRVAEIFPDATIGGLTDVTPISWPAVVCLDLL
jgi:hypothetical protein